MANLWENFGLAFLYEDEDSLMGILSYTAQEGKGILGYRDAPYIYHSFGDTELFLRTQKNEEGGLTVEGCDVHCGGPCIWNVLHSGFDITMQKERAHVHTALFRREDGSGFVPIEIITADVLPSFLAGDRLTVQVIGLPLEVHYHADEDAYDRAQPTDEDGRAWRPAAGALFPASFLHNHAPERYEQGKEYVSDRFVLFRATAKKLSWGCFDCNGEKQRTFVRCFVDTDFGELEFDHAVDQVAEAERENIRVGAVISGVAVLSGDLRI